MRVAVIGLGVIGALHAQLVQKNADLVAVCDVDEKRLVPYAGARHYTDYKRMLDEVELDAVHICTPHHVHAEMTVAALKRGINVLCEKPLCINLSQLEEVLEAEKNSSAQLGVCLQNRYLPVNRFAKDFLFQNPPIGAMGYMTWQRGKSYYDSAAWRGKKATEGGGVLINQALHTLDLLQWFCGGAESVCASVSNLTLQSEIEVEDTACVLCEGSVRFTFFATNGGKTDFPVEINVKTEKGVLKVTPQRVELDGNPLYVEGVTTYHVKPCYGHGHEPLIQDFYRCIQTGERFSIDGAEGAKVLKMILAAYQSDGTWQSV